MRIYLAGSCSSENRTTMVSIAKQLREKGLEVYCPWELQIENSWRMNQEAWSRKVFEADVSEIEACDIFFMISKGRISSAGTNWEQGYAFAKNKEIYVLQITDEPTSLMSFCGCNFFYNTNIKKINEKLDWLISLWEKKKKPLTVKECKTILT